MPSKSNKIEADNDRSVVESIKKKKNVKLAVDRKNSKLDGALIGSDEGNNKEEVVSIESDPILIERNKSKKKKHRRDTSLEEKREKQKKKKKHNKDGSSITAQEEDNSVDNQGNARSIDGVEHEDKGKKRKAETIERNNSEKKKHKKGASTQSPKEVEHANKGKEEKKKKTQVAENFKPIKSKKKVRFSGKNDVFILPPKEEDNLVKGKRFTKEEDEILKQSVFHYIAKHNFGKDEKEGLDMILNCKKHKELRGCWKEIGLQIPYRPYMACYYRAHIIFRRSESRKWTQEEYEIVLKHQAEHGNNWKPIAEELGKHMWHVKDTWRRIHLRNTVKKGHWSQDEYQKLFDLVNKDLQAKAFEEKHSKHGMLRDNIPWTAISEEVSTRNQVSCCMKWYNQLMSRLVAEGVWADVDDYALIGALYNLDANCIEDVDWDDILENRSGDLCRKRWNQMVLHTSHHGNKSFSEQVEILAQRYCPHLLEARKAWDSKPMVNP